MASENHCPYFGQDPHLCDVGCGYISNYEVDLIIRYCSSAKGYPRCPTYQRLQHQSQTAAAASNLPTDSETQTAPRAEPVVGFTMKWSLCHIRRPFSWGRPGHKPAVAQQEPHLTLMPAIPGNSQAQGFLCLGLALLLHCLQLLQGTTASLSALEIATVLGFVGAGLALCGVGEWQRNQLLMATVFISWSAYWSSLGCHQLFNPTARGIAMGAFFGLWSLLGWGFLLGSWAANRHQQGIFAGMALYLLCLSVAQFTGLPGFLPIATIIGAGTGFWATGFGLCQSLPQWQGAASRLPESKDARSHIPG